MTNEGKFNKEVNSIFERRTALLRQLVMNDLLVPPGKAFARIQILFNSLQTSNRLDQESILLILRSPAPNAFCVGEGTVVVSTGLLSKLENEEQLLWVMAHELAHYELDHVNQRIYNSVRQNLGHRNEFKNLFDPNREISLETLNTYKQMAYDMGTYSRRNELEADSLGYLIYQGLDLPDMSPIHALHHLDSVFQENSLHGIEELFNFPDYKFQSFWTKKRSNYFSAKPGNPFLQGDSTESHPEIPDRIEKLQADFNIRSSQTGPVTQLDSTYHLENFYSAYLTKNYDLLIFLATRHYENRKFKKAIVRLISSALLELQDLKGKPTFNFLVSPFTYSYGKDLREVNNFLHNTRKQDLLTIGFLFLNDSDHFDPSDETHFFMLWKYASALDDFQLMREIKRSYLRHFDKPKYAKEM